MNNDDFYLETVVSMPFGQNCYLSHLAERDDCLVIDPGLDPDAILRYLDQRRLTPSAILNTHGHADHIAGNAAIKDRWPDCPLVIGRRDAPKLTDARLNLSAQFGLPLTSPPADVLLEDGQHYSAAGFDLDVYEISGHSIGHVVFIWRSHQPPYVFGGDVLFAGGIGRYDLPDGSLAALASGIHGKLFTLPDDTIVLSGHGPPTTIGEEKASNPYVGRPSGWRGER